jgi:hypothetical protein
MAASGKSGRIVFAQLHCALRQPDTFSHLPRI